MFLDLNYFVITRKGESVTSDLCSWRLFDSSLAEMVKEDLNMGRDPRVTVHVEYETYGKSPKEFSGSFGEYLKKTGYSSIEEYLEDD